MTGRRWSGSYSCCGTGSVGDRSRRTRWASRASRAGAGWPSGPRPAPGPSTTRSSTRTAPRCRYRDRREPARRDPAATPGRLPSRDPRSRRRPRHKPRILYADRGYDYDKYRRKLRERGITARIARRGVAPGPDWAPSAGSSNAASPGSTSSNASAPATRSAPISTSDSCTWPTPSSAGANSQADHSETRSQPWPPTSPATGPRRPAGRRIFRTGLLGAGSCRRWRSGLVNTEVRQGRGAGPYAEKAVWGHYSPPDAPPSSARVGTCSAGRPALHVIDSSPRTWIELGRTAIRASWAARRRAGRLENVMVRARTARSAK